jgi:hypothetical protein
VSHGRRPCTLALHRTRFAVAYVLLTGVLAASVLGSWALASHSRSTGTPTCSGPAGSTDPIWTATAFIRNAVERANVPRSYNLVTPAFREGVSCDEWTAGNLPVQPFKGVDWGRANYSAFAAGTGQIVLRVKLFSLGPRPPAEFILELRENDAGRWLVGFWERTEAPAPRPKA